MSDSTGFEYRNQKAETPFETFLKYSNEKEESSKQLADIMQRHTKEGSSILDVGAGNGEYLRLTLDKISRLPNPKLTLVEPSADLAKNLPVLFTQAASILVTSFDDFRTKETFDIILASHLFYHLRRASWPDVLHKMTALLKPGGILVVVLRGEDDVYAFKNMFKPQLFNEDFKALVLGDVLEMLPSEAGLKVERTIVNSRLKIPYKENQADTISIIEFFLNKQWSEIPVQVQQDAMAFIEAKQGEFRQADGIAVIQKPDVV